MTGLSVNRRHALAWGVSGSAALTLPHWAQARVVADGVGQTPDPAALESSVDAIVNAFMRSFETPGIAVAVVRKGAPPLLKGYGVRTRGARAPVDLHTRFGIASNSKAFTAAALAMLVEEGKIAWDDPLTQHMPDFKMADPAVTKLFNVRDLLVHRSGLPLGAGDLLYFPKSNRTVQDAIRALQFLQPVRPFRGGYDYDNILYIVAGALIELKSGQSWRDFIRTRMLEPLGMADAVPSLDLLSTSNVAGRHARLGPPVRGVGPMQVIEPDESPVVDAGAGINASITDVAKWLDVQLALGALPGGKHLWSKESAVEMWTPQTIIASSDGGTDQNPVRAIMQGYALGWFVQDYRGKRLISHSGGLSGQVTQTALIPSAGIGVAVLSNTEDSVSGGIRNAILDHLLGAPAFDWVASYVARNKTAAENAAKVMGDGTSTKPEGGPSLPLSAYVGRYRDVWYGDIQVVQRKGGLHIDFAPHPQFASLLEPWGNDAFRTRMAPGKGEDAVISFIIKQGQIAGIKMKALSPLADFSYDYHHLDFTPVGAGQGK